MELIFAVLKKALDIAFSKEHWPLLLLAMIPGALEIIPRYWPHPFIDPISDPRFLIFSGATCILSGILYLATSRQTLPPLWRRVSLSILDLKYRLWVSLFLVVAGTAVLIMGLLPRIADNTLVITVVQFYPNSPEADEEARNISFEIHEKLTKMQADVRLLKVNEYVDTGESKVNSYDAAISLGESRKGNAHVVVWGRVLKQHDELKVFPSLAVTKHWQNVNIDGKALPEFSNSEPKHIELKEFEKDVPDHIANLVMFLYGLACYRGAILDPQPRYWDRAIEILSSIDSNEAYFYTGLCWQERATQVREANEAKDNLAKAISAFRKILGDNPAEWKISDQSEELTYAAYYNGANALAELALLSPPQNALDILGIARELYETAVVVRTREKFPLEWAFAQNNLGNVLIELGTRANDGSQDLQAAVNAYNQALQMYAQRDEQRKYPVEWATTQNNLGNAYIYLGSREDGANDMLKAAVTAYNQAIQSYEDAGSSQDWARAYSNRGYALTVLGSREDGANEDLNNAVKSCNKALEIRTQKKMPQDWAFTQNNLAYALRELGNRLDGNAGTRMLRRAKDACEAALGVYDETDPVNWAMTKDSLGRSLCDLGARLRGEDGKKLIKDALQAYEEAANVHTREYLPQKWAYTQSNIGKALVALSKLESGTDAQDHLEQGKVKLKDAQLFYQGNYPAQYKEIQVLLINIVKSTGSQ